MLENNQLINETVSDPNALGDKQPKSKVISGPKRMLHHKVWKSIQFSKLEYWERLLYLGTLTLADDDGRFIANSKILKAEIFPLDDPIDSKMIDEMKSHIKKVGLVKFYEIDETEYGLHPKWKLYQSLRKDRRKISAIPPPPEENNLEPVRQPSDTQVTTQAKTNKDILTNIDISESLSHFRKDFGDPYKPKYPVSTFEPANNEQNQCLEIAQFLGESHMDFTLMALNKYGIDVIIYAYDETKNADQAGKVNNRRAYFNSIVCKKGKERAGDTPPQDIDSEPPILEGDI